jgi:hypothetical protein
MGRLIQPKQSLVPPLPIHTHLLWTTYKWFLCRQSVDPLQFNYVLFNSFQDQQFQVISFNLFSCPPTTSDLITTFCDHMDTPLVLSNAVLLPPVRPSPPTCAHLWNLYMGHQLTPGFIHPKHWLGTFIHPCSRTLKASSIHWMPAVKAEGHGCSCGISTRIFIK